MSKALCYIIKRYKTNELYVRYLCHNYTVPAQPTHFLDEASHAHAQRKFIFILELVLQTLWITKELYWQKNESFKECITGYDLGAAKYSRQMLQWLD